MRINDMTQCLRRKNMKQIYGDFMSKIEITKWDYSYWDAYKTKRGFYISLGKYLIQIKRKQNKN